jgi:hypothetical protein
LRVVLAPDDCAIPGFIGLDLFTLPTEFRTSGFTLTGPGEAPRLNERNERLADLITCIYPRPKQVEANRSVNYIPPPMTDTGQVDGQ